MIVRRPVLSAACLLLTMGAACAAAPPVAGDLAGQVNPFIGTTNGGNVYPGATMPFGLVAFSPEQTPLPGKRFPIAAPGGYEWRANGVRGFSLTRVSGSGCTGAGGDIPLMPVTVPVAASPSSVDAGLMYASLLDHAKEQAHPGAYSLTLDNGVGVSLGATAPPRRAVSSSPPTSRRICCSARPTARWAAAPRRSISTRPRAR
jgi:putative alpha-1,2-mannosidase